MKIGKLEITRDAWYWHGEEQNQRSMVGNSFSFQDGERIMQMLGVSLDEVTVTPLTAFSIASYFGCVKLISDMIATQPLRLYNEAQGKRTEDKENPIYSLMKKRPHEQQSAFVFRRTLLMNTLTWGFGIAKIERDAFYNIISIRALDSAKVSIYETLDEKIYFNYRGLEWLNPEDVIHLKYLDFGGLVGIAPCRFQYKTIKIGLGSKQFIDSYYEKGTFLGGLLTTDANLSKETAESVKKSWKDSNKQGVQNSGDVAVLGNGVKFQELGKTPVESQLVEFLNKSDSDIYKIFGVPPFMLGDVSTSTSWGSGIEQQFIGFVNTTLMPLIEQLEQELSYKLLATYEQDTHSFQIDLDGLLRGDIKTRVEYYRTMIQNGIMSQNEVREMETLNDVEGGDKRWIQQNMMPMDKAEEILLSKQGNDKNTINSQGN